MATFTQEFTEEELRKMSGRQLLDRVQYLAQCVLVFKSNDVQLKIAEQTELTDTEFLRRAEGDN